LIQDVADKQGIESFERTIGGAPAAGATLEASKAMKHVIVRGIIATIAVAVLLAPEMKPASGSEAQAKFYVSPSGSDRNPGTRESPFRTVGQARDAVRGVNRGANSDIIVELSAGTYRLAGPLTFGSEDSGTGGHRVIYRAAPGAMTVISGGRVVTGWQPDTGGRWKAKVDVPNFRQLYVNGVRAVRARGPIPAGLQQWGSQEGVITSPAGNPPWGALEVHGEAGYRTTNGAIAGWKNPADIEFGYYNSWTHMICRIQRIDRDGDGAIIVMAQPAFYLATHKAGTQAGTPDYVENALELLDQPGEWYFDRAQRVLYYMPRPGEDMAKTEVIAPALEKLVDIRGTLDNPVHDIQFEGITFAHATWLRPSEFGHPDTQANFIPPLDNCYVEPEGQRALGSVNGECLKSPANVVVDAAKGIRFEGCTFTHLGGAGIDLQHGAQGNEVDRCRFYDISGSGVQVGDVLREDHHPSDPRGAVKGNRITNSIITRIGAEYQDSVGVFCGYTDGTVIAHNEIFDLPYTGISVGWGWGMPDAGGGAYASPKVWDTPTVSGNNRIEYNHIHHVMRLRNDGGAIYTLSRQPGTIVRGNYIHNNGPGGPGGIYLDEGSADIEVTGNAVSAVARAMNYNDYAQGRNSTCREHDNLFGIVSTTDGIIGRALHCDGLTCIEVPHKPELDTPLLTVEAWVKINKFPSGWDPREWVVCKQANEWDNANYSLLIDRNNVSAYLNIGGGQANCFNSVSTGGPVRLNTWCQIAMTYDGDTLKTYCDGKEASATRIGKPRTIGASPLTLGGRLDRYSFFDGDLDEVRIYSRALSAEEIGRNYAAVRANKPETVREGLVGHWGFEDVSAPQATIDRIIREAGPK